MEQGRLPAEWPIPMARTLVPAVRLRVDSGSVSGQIGSERRDGSGLPSHLSVFGRETAAYNSMLRLYTSQLILSSSQLLHGLPRIAMLQRTFRAWQHLQATIERFRPVPMLDVCVGGLKIKLGLRWHSCSSNEERAMWRSRNFAMAAAQAHVLNVWKKYP